MARILIYSKGFQYFKMRLMQRGGKERRNKGIVFVRPEGWNVSLTENHVVLRMQVERLPAEFRSRHQFPFASDLQIGIPIKRKMAAFYDVDTFATIIIIKVKSFNGPSAGESREEWE